MTRSVAVRLLSGRRRVASLPPATVPATPAAPVAVAGNGQASVSWTPPNSGGSPITGYQIQKYLAGVSNGAPIAVPASPATKTLTGLTNGSSYRFTVAAINSVGTSSYSAQSNPVVPIVDPLPPPRVKFVAWTAGSLPVGQASYLPPTGSKYVDPINGVDGAGRGAVGVPFRTVNAAIAAAAAGGTVVLRGGTYRQGQITVGTTRPGLTVQNYPEEAAWLTGSVVIPSGTAGPVSTGASQWVSDAGDWRHDGWTVRFDRSANPITIDPKYPAAAHPDQVFIDGARQVQVLTRAAVVPGAFYLNESTSQLFIGTDPTGKKVEASDTSTALLVQAQDAQVLGIGFKHYATPDAYQAAARGTASNQLWENCWGQDCSRAAFKGLNGTGITYSKVTAINNGQMGIRGTNASGMVLDLCEAANNNVERFIAGQAAGGAKLDTYCNGARVRDSYFHDNLGTGCWFDLRCDGSHMVRNVAEGNTGAGLFYEVGTAYGTAYGIVAGNLLIRDGVGLQYGESSKMKVYNNTFVDNGEDLKTYDGFRTTNTDLPGNPAIPKVADLTWRNNIFARSFAGVQPVYEVTDANKQRTLADFAWTSNNNAFWRKTLPAAPILALVANGVSNPATRATLALVQSTTGQEAASVISDNTATNPYLNDDYTPKSAAQTATRASLPADVAAAVGLPAGVPAALGAIQPVATTTTTWRAGIPTTGALWGATVNNHPPETETNGEKLIATMEFRLGGVMGAHRIFVSPGSSANTDKANFNSDRVKASLDGDAAARPNMRTSILSLRPPYGMTIPQLTADTTGILQDEVNRLKARTHPIVVTIGHEIDINLAGSTRAEYNALITKFFSMLKTQASQITTIVIFSGYRFAPNWILAGQPATGSGSVISASEVKQFLPLGNTTTGVRLLDLIGVDPYLNSSAGAAGYNATYGSIEAMLDPWVTLCAGGYGQGINRPMFLPEYGAMWRSGVRTWWHRQVHDYVQAHPIIKGALAFHDIGGLSQGPTGDGGVHDMWIDDPQFNSAQGETASLLTENQRVRALSYFNPGDGR